MYPDGLSPANFSNPDHMPQFLEEVLENASDDIKSMCGNNVECIFDAIETGDTNIGLETLNTNQNNNNDQVIACKHAVLGSNYSGYSAKNYHKGIQF